MKTYKRANPYKSNQQVQFNVNEIWNHCKEFENFEARILVHIDDLGNIILLAGIQKYFKIAARSVIDEANAKATNVCNKPPLKVKQPLQEDSSYNPQVVGESNTSAAALEEASVIEISRDKAPLCESSVSNTNSNSNVPTIDEAPTAEGKENTEPNVFDRPAQKVIRAEIDLLNADMVGLIKRKQVGMLSSDQEKDLQQKITKTNFLRKKLNRKIGDVRRSRKHRQKRRQNLRKFIEEHPETMNALQIQSSVGRPRVEVSQPLLLQVTADIALFGSAAHERRQSDMIRSIKTLNELTKEVQNRGFVISRSALYLRLIPRRSTSIEGLRHVATCPVKLIRAQNDHHSKHIDGHFCTATIRSLEDLASVLGPKETFFLSQDDKARVNIGIVISWR